MDPILLNQIPILCLGLAGCEKMFYCTLKTSARAKPAKALRIVLGLMPGMPVRDVLATQEAGDSDGLVGLPGVAGAGCPQCVRFRKERKSG